MQSTLPAVLEPHRTYLDRAHELAGPHPLVALQCRLMCLQLAMAARSERRDLTELAACELRQWIVTTLEECEAARARLGATAADPKAALAALRALGLELIGRASHSDRPDVHPSPALEWTVQEAPLVAKCFHAGAVLLDCCKQFGPLPAELLQAQLQALGRSRALARALSTSLRAPPCIPLGWEPAPPGALSPAAPAPAAPLPHAPPPAAPPHAAPPPHAGAEPFAGAVSSLGAAFAGLGGGAGGSSVGGGAVSYGGYGGGEGGVGASGGGGGGGGEDSSGSSGWADSAKTAAAAAAVGGVAVSAVVGSTLLGVAAAGATAYAALAKKDGAGEAAPLPQL